MASFLSDGDPVGFIGDAQHEQFKRNMLALAVAIRASTENPFASADVRSATTRLFDDYFGTDA
jgi:hypothetical protein